jgi:mannosyltransferase
MPSLVFDDIIYWLQPAGGITTYWNEITRRLAAQVHDVHRLGFAQESMSRFYRAPPPEQQQTRQKLTPKLARYGSAPLGQADEGAVFHTSYYRRPSHRKCTNVVTVYDFTYERYRSGFARTVHSWQKFAAIRAADLVICISENTLRDVMHYLPDVPADKLVAIPLGVSEEFYKLDATNLANAASNQVVFVGERVGYKRFDLAVDAVALCSDLSLTVVGAAPSDDERRMLDARLPHRWTYAGRISIEALNRLYNTAFALIYPSDYEGFGLPLLEAMRAGCPVVCSNLSSLPEVGGAATLFASAQDAGAYAVELERLRENAIRGEYVRRGSIQARRFTWDACAARTLQAYELAAIRR